MGSGPTITSRFLATVRSRPDALALRRKVGDTYETTTWAQYADGASRAAECGADPARVVTTWDVDTLLAWTSRAS